MVYRWFTDRHVSWEIWKCRNIVWEPLDQAGFIHEGLTLLFFQTPSVISWNLWWNAITQSSCLVWFESTIYIHFCQSSMTSQWQETVLSLASQTWRACPACLGCRACPAWACLACQMPAQSLEIAVSRQSACEPFVGGEGCRINKIKRWIPSGEHTKSYWKSQFLMGKSTIFMAMFNCYVNLLEGKCHGVSGCWTVAGLQLSSCHALFKVWSFAENFKTLNRALSNHGFPQSAALNQAGTAIAYFAFILRHSVRHAQDIRIIWPKQPQNVMIM